MAEHWLASKEWQQREDFLSQCVSSARLAAESSRQTALWAKFAAIAAVLLSLGVAGRVLFER